MKDLGYLLSYTYNDSISIVFAHQVLLKKQMMGWILKSKDLEKQMNVNRLDTCTQFSLTTNHLTLLRHITHVKFGSFSLKPHNLPYVMFPIK